MASQMCQQNCTVGDYCDTDAACLSNVCNVFCQALNCQDGRQNGIEVGVDCGGDCLVTCPESIIFTWANMVDAMSSWQRSFLIASFVLLCFVLGLWFTCMYINRRERYNSSKVEQEQFLGMVAKANKAKAKSRRIETCHLVSQKKVIEGWLKVKDDKWKWRYCVLFGGPHAVLSCYEDVVQGDQNNLYVGEHVRLPMSSVRNIAGANRNSQFTILYYPSGGHDSNNASTFHVKARNQFDCDQWVGKLRVCLYDSAALKRQQIRVDLDDI